MHFVYILQSLKTGQFYVGQTDHLLRRYYQHQKGITLSTRNRGPWWIPHYEIYDDHVSAVRREREIKAKKSSDSIKRIIQRAQLVFSNERPETRR